MTTEGTLRERLLVLMPTSKDAERTAKSLCNVGIGCVACPNLKVLCDEIRKGAGAALLTEEAILNDSDRYLASALQHEPSWSMFPLIVLTHQDRQTPHLNLMNVTLVERPVRLATLQSVVQAALRHRRHQYAIRDTLLDLTRRTEELRASEERFRALVSQATTGIAQVDLDGRFLFANERFQEMLGYQEAELKQLKIDDITHPEDVERCQTRFHALLAGGTDFRIEKRYLRKDGPIIWASDSVAGVSDASGNLQSLVFVTLDITARKESERQLAQAQQDLQLANRELERRVEERTSKLQETIGELEAFSYSISHDLRSPLRAMQGYSALLLESASERLDEEGRLYLSKISASAARLDLLVQDVLAYSKIAKGEVELQTIHMGDLIKNVMEGYPQLKEKATVTLHEPFPPVKGHPAYLTQCVSNLLGNAVKFVRPGVAAAVTIRAEETGDQVRFWFEDNGIGIDPRHFKSIFEIFGRAHDAKLYEGTGIGLAIVKKAAERMGGDVGVLSEPGQGSSFWLSLKRA